MLFSSVTFIFYFLPAFLVLYYLTGIKNSVLLTGSAFFYVWGEGEYIFLLLGLLVANQAAGLMIEKSVGHHRIVVFSTFVVLNFVILGIFKYSQFVLDVYASATGAVVPKLHMHLPLGISFFIFQLVSYLVEVYRKSVPAERNFIRLSTYVMMFPHLVAGPIVRYTDIMHELRNRTVNLEMSGLGVQYFIVGLSQKVLIANTLAPVADHVFGLPIASLSALNSWIGTLAYTFQIFFDFCGYSNMAIGLALLLGFRFPRNFDYPYSSKSITEFWRRWHMSLSFWFRDYLYIPLGGSRGSALKNIRNLAIVFFVTGLWHGAAWTFIFWGMFHGFFVIIERLFLRSALEQLPSIFARVYTLLVVMVGWVFFRADDFKHGTKIVAAMFGFGSGTSWDPLPAWIGPEALIAFVAGAILSFPIVPFILERVKAVRIPGPGVPGRTHLELYEVSAIPIPLLLCGLLMSICLLASSSLNPFLYFRF